MSALSKRLIYAGGFLLAGVSLVFVVVSLIQNAEEIDVSNLSLPVIAVLILLTMGYGFINLLLALAWHELLQHFDQNVGRIWAIWAYGVSQLAKYAPGNLFHLAGRQAIGVTAGLPNWPLAKSIVWELGIIALAAIPFIFLPLPLVINDPIWLVPSVLMFGGSVGIMASIAWRLFGNRVSRVVLIHITFLLISALIFIMIVAVTLSLTFTPSVLTAITGAYVVAWLAGLITPGAPAGIGVREVVLYALLHTIISQADLLLVIAIGRLVTVGGDLLYFCAALTMPMLWPAIRPSTHQEL